MRYVVLLLVLCLSACALPQAERYYFQGVYTPGEAAIAENGQFITRASVWRAAQMPIAQQAALFRLKQAAEVRGYDYFIPDDAQVSDGGGNQFIMTGRLFRQGHAPGNAMPIDLLEAAGIRAGQGPPTSPRIESPRSLSSGTVEQTPAENGEPLVIEAPDFG